MRGGISHNDLGLTGKLVINYNGDPYGLARLALPAFSVQVMPYYAGFIDHPGEPPLMNLPTGTVTFLFTDIEGSTTLWEHQPEAMRSALARHNVLLHQAIAAHDGVVFKTIGDAFCAAFATASQALTAAFTAQLALQSELWPGDVTLWVRMALHTGSADEVDGDYFGPPLNRVARLLATGHGGQTLLSQPTYELTRDALPSHCTLMNLGTHSLRDLTRPEQVYHLCHPDLASEFPPLKSLNYLPNNLPQQMTSFIGRERELAQIKELLAKTRLLTLTGSGGCGKTRLSLQVAADLLDQYVNGVWLIELAALSDPALVPQAIADVLGVQEQPGKTMQRSLVEALRPKQLLLVLDNCEHLVAACASLAADLLRTCPQIHILATSREPLNIAGEQSYRVPSLSLPDPKQTQNAETLSQYEAVRLFIERVQAMQPSFTVTNANAPAVAQVCWRLDGIPLAIELAAARVRSLSVEDVSTRLDNRFRLLIGGVRNTLPRQQTLRALIDWSYDLLTENEKTLLRRLSVFVGGWTLPAAEAVGVGEDAADGGIEGWEVVDLLTSLVDKSLVVYEAGADDGGRARLLETIRQYAGDRLQESREAEAVQSRAASWFLHLAEEAFPQLMGSEQALWLRRLETEHDNLRVSLTWYEQLSERGGEFRMEGVEGGLRLAGALVRFWSIRGHYSEGRQWLDRALRHRALGRGLEDASTAIGGTSAVSRRALNGAGDLAARQGDFAVAQTFFEESLTLARRSGDQEGVAASLNGLGTLAAMQGEFAEARTFLEESLALRRMLGDQQGISASLRNLGFVATSQTDYAAARAFHEESLALERQIGNQDGIATALLGLGGVATSQADDAAARAFYEESLALYRQLGDQDGITVSLRSLGGVASDQGEHAAARAFYEESLALYRQLGDQHGIADTLNGLGEVAYSQGEYTAAWVFFEESIMAQRQIGDQYGISWSLHCIAKLAQVQDRALKTVRLLGAADTLHEVMDAPLNLKDQEERDKLLSASRASLGDASFISAWEAGRAMSIDQAVEYALEQEP